MAIFGNRWSSALIGASLRGLTRFGDFVEAPGGPAESRRRTVAGLLRHRRARGQGAGGDGDGRAEYHLTEKGHAFYPVVAVAIDWAQHWYAAAEGPALWSSSTCRAGLRSPSRSPVTSARPTFTAATSRSCPRRGGPLVTHRPKDPDTTRINRSQGSSHRRDHHLTKNPKECRAMANARGLHPPEKVADYRARGWWSERDPRRDLRRPGARPRRRARRRRPRQP